MKNRRSTFDVTNTIEVSSPSCVRDAVVDLMRMTYPGNAFDSLGSAFDDLERLFSGKYAGYQRCDTVYHDLQHTLDVTLAIARLIAGHDKSQSEPDRLGPERAYVALIIALFHDSGYIRRVDDDAHRNGAEYTRSHVARGARFITTYLTNVGLGEYAPIAARIVHFTGHEVALESIQVDDPKFMLIGHMIGTADLLAQMSDRCYLEKCRDRLYPEFVVGGVATGHQVDGKVTINYESGIDLLRKTPEFYGDITRERLEGAFNKVYRHLEPLFDGTNPYMEAVEKNLAFLKKVIEEDKWPLLRRRPPTEPTKNSDINATQSLAVEQLNKLRTRSKTG